MFALVDANNMYVSCERVFQPRLCGRPVVVLSSNDGACIARSNEAKDLGVRMAQPWFQVRHLERSAGLLAVSANFELYGDMSSRMMAVVARFAPRQEVYSIDESFLDFDGVRGDLVGIGRNLRATVLMETGLPTSVGFGPTKTLAKLANHIAKTADRKPGSYTGHLAQVCNLVTLSEADRLKAFAATEVGNVWGVGRKIGARLVEGGVRTVLDLVRCDVATLRKQFSVVLEKTVLELRGTSCLSIDEALFAATVAGILSDPQGWQTADGVRFVPVSPAQIAAGAGVDVRVTLATPTLTGKLCGPLNVTAANVSCWWGGRAVLNLHRWVRGSATYGTDLTSYRTYLVNHEVGHGLGHRHVSCPAPGRPAPRRSGRPTARPRWSW